MKNYLNILKQSGHKLTNPRKQLLAVLSEQKRPISAHELHAVLKKKLDLVSVYRTLTLFEQLGIASKETLGNEALYHLGHHHHITCTSCGRTECVPCEHQLPPIKRFTNITHQLLLSGICAPCSKK